MSFQIPSHNPDIKMIDLKVKENSNNKKKINYKYPSASTRYNGMKKGKFVFVWTKKVRKYPIIF